MKRRLTFWLGACFFFSRALSAQDFVDQIDRALTISLAHDQLRARLSGLLDFEYYHFPQPPPGLLRAGEHNLFAPRLTLFLDAHLGAKIYFFAQSRLDTGFDPSDLGAEVRIDEFALRVTPWPNGCFNLQVGKFATVIGSWVERHHSWENPFVNAPLPYETFTRVSDMIIPKTGQSFRNVQGSEKYEFLPVIWGPVYAAGVAVTGRIGIFEYAAELKNTPLASRPGSWSGYNFDRPAVDLRVGLQPGPAWRLGFSAAEGSYLRPGAKRQLEEGGLADYRGIVIGQDISYARGPLQVWAEIFEARFEVPRLGDADVLAYYLEAKYKISPQLFGALRWNQELFASGRDASGQPVARGPDISRVDVALGYRFTAHAQLKLQYSLARGDFVSSGFGSTFAAQFTVRF